MLVKTKLFIFNQIVCKYKLKYINLSIINQIFCIVFLFFCIVGCDDSYENIYRYSKIISQSKNYPVYLDMSEIGNIQVKEQSTLIAPFKIRSNDKYYFVGDMLKGVHVYEKAAGAVNYLCFIECKYLKTIELIDNQLFCNNFVDLVVIDVTDPLQIQILHREKNHFNRFTEYVEYWNIPYVESKGIIVGYQSHVISGIVTEKQQNLDFTEYDQLYENLTTKTIPDSWITNKPEEDKPYLGMVKVGDDEIYTYGKYNSWNICTYRSGYFRTREENIWSSSRGNYAPPYYYSGAYPFRMIYKDSIIYILGKSFNNQSGYSSCIVHRDEYPVPYSLYFPDFKPVDITYLSNAKAFFALSGQSIWGMYKHSDPVMGTMERYKDYQILSDAVAIFEERGMLITLGKELSVYSLSNDEIKIVREYKNISGTSYLKEGEVLVIVNPQGLFFYNINDLENIQLIQ